MNAPQGARRIDWLFVPGNNGHNTFDVTIHGHAWNDISNLAQLHVQWVMPERIRRDNPSWLEVGATLSQSAIKQSAIVVQFRDKTRTGF